MQTEFQGGDSGLLFQPFVVGFFDLLGQKQHLSGLENIPDAKSSSEEREQFKKAEYRTVGAVQRFRSFWAACEESSRNAPLRFLEGLDLSAEWEQKLLVSQQTETFFQGFGDTVVVFLPVVGLNGYFQILAIEWMLEVAANAFVMFLANGDPFRGGIDAGIGAICYENEIYGPVTAGAVHLEADIAKWPRIVIGDRVINLLKSVQAGVPPKRTADPIDPVLVEYFRGEAEKCLDIIFKDSDGAMALDFLSPRVSPEAADLRIAHDKMVRRAFAFTVHEVKRFSDEGDRKLEDRYRKVAEYFIERVPNLVGAGGSDVGEEGKSAGKKS